MRDHLILYINGQRHKVGHSQSTKTLADFLRSQGLVGTKIVCNEGDCGACSVLVGHDDPDTGRLCYKTIDSCIVFLYQLDRSHIITVEGLGSLEQPSPVQTAMVQCHGSQCGFCTPGFVVALHGMIESGCDLDDKSLRSGLSGNLCRCTGYQQIFDAGAAIDPESAGKLEQRYPSEPMLKEFRNLAAEALLAGPNPIYLPATVQQACRWKASNPSASFVGGATDVGVLHNHGRLAESDIIHLNSISDFAKISVEDDRLTIGGGANWSQIERVIETLFPPYHEVITRFGSPQIRNLGTLAGNLATGSPIADSIPFHLVMDSQLHLASARGERTIPLSDFYTGYRENVMADDELICRVDTPLLAENERLAVHKISKRRDMDISTLTMAIWLRLEGQTVQQARLAIGGVGPTVARVTAAEEHLCGAALSIDSFQRAGIIAAEEIRPWTDVRGSSEFRLKLTENLLIKSYYQISESLHLAT